MSPELISKIAQWRAKAAEGALTVDEMREAIKLIREDRVAAVSSTTSARKKAAAVIPSADDLLAELGD